MKLTDETQTLLDHVMLGPYAVYRQQLHRKIAAVSAAVVTQPEDNPSIPATQANMLLCASAVVEAIDRLAILLVTKDPARVPGQVSGN